MTMEIVKYSLKNNCFNFTSTSDVYGNSNFFEEDEKIKIGPPTNERYSYAMSKLVSEQYIFNELHQSGLMVVLLGYLDVHRRDLNLHGLLVMYLYLSIMP